MPLRRTPPSKPKSPVITEDDLLMNNNLDSSLSGSAPNLNTIEKSSLKTRNKRKREDELATFMQEIRDLIQTSTKETENKFIALQSSMTEIIAQNLELKNSLTFVSRQYDDLKLKIDECEQERKTERHYIHKLEEKIENLERTLCLTKLEIRNIPKKEGETKEDLHQIVSKTADVVEVMLERQDVKDIYRINKKEGSSSIIVDFTAVTAREKFLGKVRQFNRKNTNKINTSHLKIEGEIKPIYFSEYLSTKAQRLFYQARQFAKDNNYKYCWTAFGKVYLRQSEGKRYFVIKSEDDLKVIIEQ